MQPTPAKNVQSKYGSNVKKQFTNRRLRTQERNDKMAFSLCSSQLKLQRIL